MPNDSKVQTPSPAPQTSFAKPLLRGTLLAASTLTIMAGATIGVAGTLAGLILGLLFCLNIGAIQHFIEAITGVQLFNADVYMLDAIPALVDPVDVFWVAVWSLLMSCVASLPPSWSASRIDPVEALRYE